MHQVAQVSQMLLWGRADVKCQRRWTLPDAKKFVECSSFYKRNMFSAPKFTASW